MACYAIDFRGHGRSAGKFGFVRQWDEYLEDLAKFLAIENFTGQDTPLFILGHSHGGLVAAAAAQRGQLNHCAGVILSSPYLQLKMPVPLIKRFFAAIASRIYPSAKVPSGINPGMVTRDEAMIAETKSDPYCRGIATPRWFFEARKAQTKIRSMASQFDRPLLMLLPGNDLVADSRASVLFFDRCKSIDKTILHYPGYRHELLREVEREPIFQNILDWITQRNSETRIPESMAKPE